LPRKNGKKEIQENQANDLPTEILPAKAARSDSPPLFKHGLNYTPQTKQ
jgi:hypothetical protein